MLEFTDDTAPHQLAFQAYGTEVRVCANAPEILGRIEPLLPPGWERCKPTPVQQRVGMLLEDDGTYSIYNGSTRVSQGHELELSLVVIDGQLRGWVALTSPDMTFVHAGAVALDGRAIVFPGHSFSGKTTLTAALVQAGATYYSDEFAVLDSEGLVHPYPKPLSLRPPPSLGQVETPVEELGGVAGNEPLPLGMAVVTSYRPGAEWAPKPMSPGTAALAFLSNTVTARTRPDQAMQAITRAIDGAVAFESERGDASEMADRLLAGMAA
jgi:hypothetical protein